VNTAEGAKARLPGQVGVWAGSFRLQDTGLVSDAAAELDELGYGVLWFPGGTSRTFDVAATLLAGTHRSMAATGIANIWVNPPAEAAARTSELNARYDHRFLLGLGVSHQPMVERLRPGAWRSPLAAMSQYLDELDRRRPVVPRQSVVLAALGPKMLKLASSRTAGTHPYLVTPDQTAVIRDQVGPDALVAVEQGVVLDSDPASGRSRAREALEMYLALPNYVASWKRAGFTDDDVAAGGSDRLVDAVIARGSPEQAAARLRDHLDAGADHVCLQVLGPSGTPLPRQAWRDLAAALELPA
jgi:probable F420-dependent oxidoreductase